MTIYYLIVIFINQLTWDVVCRLFIHLEVNQELFKEKYQTFTFRDPSLKLGPEICEMGLWPILPVVGC